MGLPACATAANCFPPPTPSLSSNPRLDLAYVHIVEPRVAGIDDVTTTDSIAPFRQVG